MKRSLAIVTISIVVFVLAAYLVSKLEVKSNMEDMLPEDSKNLVASKDFDRYFEGQDQSVVLISNKGNLEIDEFEVRAKEIMDTLASELEQKSFVSSILYKVETDSLEPYAWAYIDMDVYDSIENALMKEDYDSLSETLSHISDENELSKDQYLVSEDENHYMMVVKPIIDQSEFDASRMAFYNGLVGIIDQIKEDYDVTQLDIGITGGAFIQDIEADTIAFSGLGGTLIITLLCILGVVIVFFGSLKLPILSMYPLIFGAVAASAAAYIIFGSINMFSVSFALLLLGLGIDFAVHLIARYKEERMTGSNLETALGISIKSTGSSIVIGAITTAFAFGTFYVARFKAFTQMGIISAVGIVILCIAMLVLMPSLIRIFDRGNTAPKMKSSRLSSFKWISHYSEWTIRRKTAIFIIVILGMGALFVNVSRTNVVTDVSAIYPDDLPSLNYAKVLEEAYDYSTNTVSIYFDSIDELRNGVIELEQLGSVSSVNSILDYMPENQDVKLEKMNKMMPYLSQLGQIGIDDGLNLDDLTLRQVSIDDLPLMIRNNYIGKEGKLLVEIMPSINLYDGEACNHFIDEVMAISGRPPVGIAIVMNEITDLVTSDILRISILCMSAIFIIALIAFRQMKYALLTVIPLGITLYLTLGLLPVFDVTINLFSIASFPIIIGIGVDGGIHLIHRLKDDGDVKISDLTMMTGKAILLTGITTMIGFGSLGTINHPGMSNFGMVVVVGMAVNLLMTLTIIPIVVSMFRVRIDTKQSSNIVVAQE